VPHTAAGALALQHHVVAEDRREFDFGFTVKRPPTQRPARPPRTASYILPLSLRSRPARWRHRRPNDMGRSIPSALAPTSPNGARRAGGGGAHRKKGARGCEGCVGVNALVGAEVSVREEAEAALAVGTIQEALARHACAAPWPRRQALGRSQRPRAPEGASMRRGVGCTRGGQGRLGGGRERRGGRSAAGAAQAGGVAVEEAGADEASRLQADEVRAWRCGSGCGACVIWSETASDGGGEDAAGRARGGVFFGGRLRVEGSGAGALAGRTGKTSPSVPATPA
jgi:hypothetical protein